MPYSRDDTPAAWWAGAQAMPPMPDEPGPWVQTPTPYGWEWRRPEPAPPDAFAAPGLTPTKAGTYRVVTTPHGLELRRDGDGHGRIVGGKSFAVAPPPGVPEYLVAPDGPFVPVPPLSDTDAQALRGAEARIRRGEAPHAPQQPAEVRVGDRVQRAEDGRVENVTDVFWTIARTDAGAGGRSLALADIGPPGSGKPWTLLAREPARAPGVVPSLPPEAATFAHTASGPIGPSGGPGPVGPSGVKLPRVAPGAGTISVYGPGGELVARIGEMSAAEFSRATAVQRWVRELRPSCLRSPRAVIDDVLRAADGVPDPRRDAERRVVDAARDLVRHANDPEAERAAGIDVVRQWEGLNAALAVLDGETPDAD